MIYKIIQWLKDFWRGTSPLFGGIKRSVDWPRIRNEMIREHPYCSCCGGRNKLEVHHIESFFRHPEKELLKSNLVVLCEAKKYGINCHLFCGHSGNYRNENPKVLEDIEYIKEKLSVNK